MRFLFSALLLFLPLVTVVTNSAQASATTTEPNVTDNGVKTSAASDSSTSTSSSSSSTSNPAPVQTSSQAPPPGPEPEPQESAPKLESALEKTSELKQETSWWSMAFFLQPIYYLLNYLAKWLDPLLLTLYNQLPEYVQHHVNTFLNLSVTTPWIIQSTKYLYYIVLSFLGALVINLILTIVRTYLDVISNVITVISDTSKIAGKLFHAVLFTGRVLKSSVSRFPSLFREDSDVELYDPPKLNKDGYSAWMQGDKLLLLLSLGTMGKKFHDGKELSHHNFPWKKIDDHEEDWRALTGYIVNNSN